MICQQLQEADIGAYTPYKYGCVTVGCLFGNDRCLVTQLLCCCLNGCSVLSNLIHGYVPTAFCVPVMIPGTVRVSDMQRQVLQYDANEYPTDKLKINIKAINLAFWKCRYLVLV